MNFAKKLLKHEKAVSTGYGFFIKWSIICGMTVNHVKIGRRIGDYVISGSGLTRESLI